MALARKDISTLWDRDMRIAIDENFKELYNEYIGAGSDAKEAREKAINAVATSDLAKQLAEQANLTSEQVRNEMNNIIREQTSGGDVVPEVVSARGENATLGERLNSTDQQLAQTSTQLEGLEVNVSTVDVYPDDGIDHTAELRSLIATGAIPVFPSGRYIISDELLFKHGQAIRTVGKVTFDGMNFVGANGNSVVRVTNEGDNYTQLPTLTHDIPLGTIQLTFSTSHGLTNDDIICIYDNTEFSWSSDRSSYKKSEFCRVASVISDTEILLDNEVFDEYDATTNLNFGVYKMNMGAFNVYGNLEIIQGKAGNFFALKIERVKDFNGEGVVCLAKNGSNVATRFDQCFNVNFKGTAIQETLSGLGNDYGLSISNCQHISAEGYFSASRHGVAHGGTNGVGAVITRDSKIRGTVKTNGLGKVPAFDTHGNCEGVLFDGTIYGGANIGGSFNKIKGTVYSDPQGICIKMHATKRFNHDFSGVKFISNANPGDMYGVIDFGGGGSSEVDNMLGGVLNLSNIEIQAPFARFGLVIRTRNTNHNSEPLDINLSSSVVNLPLDIDSVAYRITKEDGARGFRIIDLSNSIYSSNRVIVPVNDLEKLYYAKQKGRGVFTTTTTTNISSVTVTFEKPFPSGYVPVVNVTLNKGAIGSYILPKVSAISETSFTLQVLTLNGSNFGAEQTNIFTWSAE